MVSIVNKIPGKAGSNIYFKQKNLTNITLKSKVSTYVGGINDVMVGNCNILTRAPCTKINMGMKITQTFGDISNSFCDDSFFEAKTSKTIANVTNHIGANNIIIAGGMGIREDIDNESRVNIYLTDQQNFFKKIYLFVASLVILINNAAECGLLAEENNLTIDTKVALSETNKFSGVFTVTQVNSIIELLFNSSRDMSLNYTAESVFNPIANISLDSRGSITTVISDIEDPRSSPTVTFNLLNSEDLFKNHLEEKSKPDTSAVQIISQCDNKNYAAIYNTPENMFFTSKNNLNSANIYLEANNSNFQNKSITMTVETETNCSSMEMSPFGTNFYLTGANQKFHIAILNVNKTLEQKNTALEERKISLEKSQEFYNTYNNTKKQESEYSNLFYKMDTFHKDINPTKFSKQMQNNLTQIKLEHAEIKNSLNELELEKQKIDSIINTLQKSPPPGENLTQLSIEESNVALTTSENNHGFYADNKGTYLIANGISVLEKTDSGLKILGGAIKYDKQKNKLHIDENLIIFVKEDTQNKFIPAITKRYPNTLTTHIKEKQLLLEQQINYIQNNL